MQWINRQISRILGSTRWVVYGLHPPSLHWLRHLECWDIGSHSWHSGKMVYNSKEGKGRNSWNHKTHRYLGWLANFNTTVAHQAVADLVVSSHYGFILPLVHPKICLYPFPLGSTLPTESHKNVSSSFSSMQWLHWLDLKSKDSLPWPDLPCIAQEHTLLHLQNVTRDSLLSFGLGATSKVDELCIWSKQEMVRMSRPKKGVLKG